MKRFAGRNRFFAQQNHVIFRDRSDGELTVQGMPDFSDNEDFQWTLQHMGNFRSHDDATPRQTGNNVDVHSFIQQMAPQLLSGILA
jgi:hypothetical protein